MKNLVCIENHIPVIIQASFHSKYSADICSKIYQKGDGVNDADDDAEARA